MGARADANSFDIHSHVDANMRTWMKRNGALENELAVLARTSRNGKHYYSLNQKAQNSRNLTPLSYTEGMKVDAFIEKVLAEKEPNLYYADAHAEVRLIQDLANANELSRHEEFEVLGYPPCGHCQVAMRRQAEHHGIESITIHSRSKEDPTPSMWYWERGMNKFEKK